MSSQVDDLVTLMIVFLSLLAVAAFLTLFRPIWRNFKLVYHRKVPRLHRGEPLEKLWFVSLISYFPVDSILLMIDPARLRPFQAPHRQDCALGALRRRLLAVPLRLPHSR
jgi:hypothetical protein